MNVNLKDETHRESVVKALLVGAGVELLPDMTSPMEVRDGLPLLAQSFRVMTHDLTPATFDALGWKKFAFYQTAYHASILEESVGGGMITVRGWVEK